MMNYNYAQLFANQFDFIDNNPDNLKSPTRSSKVITPMHSAIAKQIQENSEYTTISLADGEEYTFEGIYGSKKVDIAVFDKNGKLKGAILFKGIRSEYNKNANNFSENMRGESALFIDSGIKVYQIIFIPTKVRKSNGKFEKPNDNSYMNYCNFINFSQQHPFWKNLKLGVFYLEMDYDNYSATYSKEKRVNGVEKTLEEGIFNFIEVLKNE